MPYYLNATASLDRANGTYQIVVHWDPNDPNTLVCQTEAGSIPTGHQFDPDKHYLTDDEMDRCLVTMGFSIVSRGTKWGERVVARSGSDHTFYDPITRDWRSVPN